MSKMLGGRSAVKKACEDFFDKLQKEALQALPFRILLVFICP